MQTCPPKLKLPDDLQWSVNDICHQFSKLSGAASSTYRTFAAALEPLSPIWDVYEPLLAWNRGDWKRCKAGIKKLNIIDPTDLFFEGKAAKDYEDTAHALYEVTNNYEEWESAENPRATSARL